MDLEVGREDTLSSGNSVTPNTSPSVESNGNNIELSKERIPRTISGDRGRIDAESLPLFFEDGLGLYSVVSSPRRNQPAYRNFQEALVAQETISILEKWLEFTFKKEALQSDVGNTKSANGNGHSHSLDTLNLMDESLPLTLDSAESVQFTLKPKKSWGALALPTLYLGTVFGDTHVPILPQKADQKLRDRLVRKNILVLGDNDESWSRVLKHFGCRVTTLKHEVSEIQHSGNGSSNGRQKLVSGKGSEDNVWNALDSTSHIRDQIGNRKFDAIVSNGFFKIGSGFEILPKEIEKRICVPKGLTASTNVPFHLTLWLVESSFLLSPSGFQVHCDFDPKPITDNYRYVSPYVKTRSFGEFREIGQEFPDISSMFIVGNGKIKGRFLKS